MTEHIALYDPQAIRDGLAGMSDGDEYGGEAVDVSGVSPEQTQWRRTLRRIADDPRGPLRPVLLGTSEMAADVADLDVRLPHFAAVTHLVRRAVIASVRTQTRCRLQPVLMVGPPGLGKTHYARRLAQALGGIHLVEIPVNLANERGRFTGYSLSWKGARISDFAAGLLAQANRCSAPMFLLEEIDKPTELVHEALLSVLEPETSKSHVDEYLTAIAPLRLDHALFLATANGVAGIPAPLLDRMLQVDIEAPVGHAMRAVIASVHADVVDTYGPRFSRKLDLRVMSSLEKLTPRRIKLVVDLAIPIAIDQGRWHLTVRDIELAAMMTSDRCNGIGFFSSARD